MANPGVASTNTGQTNEVLGVSNSQGVVTSLQCQNKTLPQSVFTSLGVATVATDTSGNPIGLDVGSGVTVPLFGLDRAITASANAVLADAGALITANHVSVAIVITILNDATIGWVNDSILAAYQAGAAAVSFSAGSGVTLHSPTGIAAATQYGVIAAARVAANEWTLI